MRKMMSFTFGVLVGTVVATAWANYSPKTHINTGALASASMNPFEMMKNLPHLPVQQHDAF